MRRIVTVAAFAAALGAAIFVLNADQPFFDEEREVERERSIVPQEGLHIHVRSSIGRSEDPAGRAYWQWLRLHDPATGRIPPGIGRAELSFAKTLPTREFLSKRGAALLEWTARGPTRIGGRTRALGIDRSNENVINAGGVSGGMWHSEDGGASWTKTTRPDQHHSVSTLIQDPRPGRENEWYYGSGEFIGNSANAPGGEYVGTGLYRSVDNGASWQLTGFERAGESPNFDTAYDVFFNIAIDPTSEDGLELYAATYGLIYKFDGTNRQIRLLDNQTSPNFSTFTDVAVTRDGIVYAALSSDGGRRGLWRSSDGDNFTPITPTGWPVVYNRTVIGVAPSNPSIVYFLSETPGTGPAEHSLWRYDATSNQWSDRTENLPTDELFPIDQDLPDSLGMFDSQGGYDLVIAVKPDDPDVVIIGGTNLYRSTDGFATTESSAWIAGYHPEEFIYPNHHPDQHAIAFYPSNPNRMLTGSDGGVHRTEDVMANASPKTPVTWISRNEGYRTTQFYSVALDESAPGSRILVGGMQDNGTVYTNEETGTEPWIGDILGGDGSFADIADGQEYFYLSTQNAQIYRVTLSPAGNIQAFARVDPPEADFEAGLFITPFHLDPNNQAMMYLGGEERLWRNDNLLAIPDGNENETSTNWTVLASTGEDGDVVTAVTPAATSSTTTRVYFATTNTTGPTRRSKIMRLDHAHTGQPTPVDITMRDGLTPMPDSAYVSSIAVDPSDPSNLMVTFSNYGVRSIYYSGDAGGSWTHVGGNLEEKPDGTGTGPSVRWGQILPVDGGTMYFVGTSTGLYSSTSLLGGPVEWVQEGASTIGNVVVDMVDARPADRVVVAATHGNGIYSATAGVDLDSEGPIDGADAYLLTAAYPNPFRSAAHFSLTVAHDQHVDVALYDQLGRRVVHLFEGLMTANIPKSFSMDASELASGVYTYQAKGERFSASRQVVLLR